MTRTEISDPVELVLAYAEAAQRARSSGVQYDFGPSTPYQLAVPF